jgi:hypothetical protein
MPVDHVVHLVYIFGRVFRAVLQREDVIHIPVPNPLGRQLDQVRRTEFCL